MKPSNAAKRMKIDPTTLQGKVLTYLKTGHSIDTAKATAMFGVFRLPVAIQYLRKKGVDVRTEIAKPPEGPSFAVYTLPKVIDKDTLPGTRVVVTGAQTRNGQQGVILDIGQSLPFPVKVCLDETGDVFPYFYDELTPEVFHGA